jgi:hypothetical protein
MKLFDGNKVSQRQCNKDGFTKTQICSSDWAVSGFIHQIILPQQFPYIN